MASSKKKRLVFLINPGAGQRAAARIKAIAPELFPADAWSLDFIDLKHWREIRPLAAEAARNGAYAVVAVGGDGTLNQVAPSLSGKRCRLGIIPAGTGNGLARALGIPLRAEEACQVLVRGHERRIDLGQMDRGRAYANMLGIGWDAWIATRANELRWLNRISGFLRYLGAAILCLGKIGPQALKLKIDGQALEGSFMVLAVANSPQYGFGCTVAPEARLDDGHFDVVCLPPLDLLSFLRNCARLFSRKPLLKAQFFRAKRIEIRSGGTQEWPIHLDGEPGGTTPALVQVKARALRVLAP
jgi:YegS/Rv2252/BmrU family lipid kinase